MKGRCGKWRALRPNLARVDHWRSHNQREAWLPKSQVEFVNAKEALIPVWLARKFGYTISTESKVYN